jgi:hypothetical protein
MMSSKRLLILAACAVLCTASGGAAAADQRPPDRFVPNSQEFWDFSKNWTTNYGPAYRDTVVDPETNFLTCTSKFALCFQSGAKPLPCKLSKDGRSATCTCTVGDGLNFVLITAILNRQVYEKTVKTCYADGSNCTAPNDAPVCKFLDKGKLIPGAQLISTFDPTSTSSIQDLAAGGAGKPTNCTGPFAGCMTAPCRFTKDGLAECTCPVFWGRFQLIGEDAQCDLGGDLVPSASYTPRLDPDVP